VNGYTNVETWLVALWFNNNQADQEFWKKRAEEARDSGENDCFSQGAAIRYLADEMKESVEYEAEKAGLTGLLSDLLGAAISAVNWSELARNHLANLEDSDAPA
jgi:hypothetical protein